MNKSEFPSLNALRVFESVARLQSFKQAAAELGVTQSAVSRQLTTLEKQLGVKLIQRDNRVHALTAAGQALAPELHRVFRQLERIVTYTINEGEQARREISIGISHEIYSQWLAPKLEEFQQLYPHLDLRFVQVQEYMDRSNEESLNGLLLRNEVDALIVLGQSKQKQLVCQTLLTLPTAAYIANDESVKQSQELIRVAHQPLPNNIKKQTALPIERQAHAQSSLMAATLAAAQQAVVILPLLYKAIIQSTPLHQHASLDVKLPLSIITRKDDERELGMVALKQWLEYRAERFKL